MNILSAWPWRGQIQIAVVVFEIDESDEFMKWLQDVCEPALSEGLLVLAKARLPDGWHASIAKNTAHRLAIETLLQAAGGSAPQPTASGSGQARSSLGGCFLLNLDGDNYLGADYLCKLSEIIRSCGPWDSVGARNGVQGTTGRVDVWAHVFLNLGG